MSNTNENKINTRKLQEMEEIKYRKGLKRHKILIYDNIDELPIGNFAQLEKNLIIESGVGAGLSDFSARINSIAQFISSDHKEKAINELNNMRNLFWNATNDIRPDFDAFSCLVHSIDGVERIASESGIEKTTEVLKLIGATKKIIDYRHRIKKKVDEQLKVSFPNMQGSLSLEILGAQKRKMLASLDEIITGEDNTLKIKKENRKISEHLQSKRFGNSEGEDVYYMRKFNKMKMILQKDVSIPINNMTTFDFYS